VDFILPFLIGFSSGFIGALASGGGLISIPALIFLGLSPSVAIATTRLSAITGSLSSIFKFKRAGIIQWKRVAPFLLSAVLGGIIGSKLLIQLDEGLLEKILGLVLLFLAPIIVFSKDFGLNVKEKGKNHKIVGFFIIFLIMIYAAMFGGGGGTFLIYALVYFYGMSIIQANANGTAMGIFATTTALIAYLFSGLVNFEVGIPLMVGSGLGGYLGAHTAIKKGNEKVKWVFLSIVLISGIKLLFF